MKKLFLMAALLLLPLAASNAQSAEELLQQALVLERSEGDYAGAIALYRLVAESAEFDRAVTGRALVQMAVAYENMGRVEAARTYQRVLVEYGDLPELAAEAREGFARTREPIEQPSTPEPGSTSVLDIPDKMVGWGRAMSPKGTFIAGPVREPAGVMVVSTHTGQETVFNFPAEAYAEVYTVRFSPDESQIATTVWQHDGDCVLTRTPRCQFDTQSSKVFILDLKTGEYSPIWNNLAYYQNREGPEACDDPEVHDWSADGSKLLLLSPWEPVCAQQPWVGEDLILLDIASGEPTVLGNLLDNQGEESYYETSCLSQDGRYAFTDVVVDNDSWAIRRYDTTTKETHIWRSIGKNTWL